jgi:hypothetical protein
MILIIRYFSGALLRMTVGKENNQLNNAIPGPDGTLGK